MAQAKLHGSYAALLGGCVGEALGDLTGGVVTVLELDSEGALATVADGSLWRSMQVRLPMAYGLWPVAYGLWPMAHI